MSHKTKTPTTFDVGVDNFCLSLRDFMSLLQEMMR